MRVTIHDDGFRYVIEAPEGARVIATDDDDCLVFEHQGETCYVIVPVAATLARQGLLGLSLVEEPSPLKNPSCEPGGALVDE